jgi:hypothetical protein
MAEKQNPGYIEQLREMRALRTQQLRGMNADQRFYANLNANQRALLQANQKLAASFDSMSKTFVSSIRGLTSAVGGLASKGASAAGGVAGGAASLAGSIASGLGKVLPFAIAGIVGKMLLWDNLTGENKNRLTSGVARLFTNIFGDLPDMFKGVIQKIVNSVSEMDIKFPIIGTLMEKTEAFIKVFSAGIELAKLKFEDLMEFFGNIKDPMKLFESGLKAMGAATLARLLLPATVSLVASIIGNRLLMGQIGDALDSRIGGSPGGRGRAGQRARRAGAAAATAGGISAGRLAAGKSVATKIATKIGASLGKGYVLSAIPVVGQLALLGYTAYEIYEIAKELGFTDDEAQQLSQEAEMKTEAMEYYGPRIDEKKAGEVQGKMAEVEKLQKFEPNPALPEFEQETQRTETKAKIEKLSKEIADIANVQKSRAAQKRDEESQGGHLGVQAAFNRIWNTLKKEEKQFAIDYAVPIIETENFVYMMGKDRKIVKMKIDEYLKLRNELDPLIPEMDRAEFERMTGKVIKQGESPVMGYNQPFAKDGKGTPFVPLPEGKTLTTMTGKEVLDYQKKQVEATKAAGIGIRNGEVVGTGAMGAYQINQGNLAEYYSKNESEKDKLFDEEQQDKIYRSLIRGAVDKFMATGDKEAFTKYVTNTWEIFKKDSKGGRKAREQLAALLDNPTFTADAGDSTKTQTKEQRAVREKMLMKMIEEGMNVIGKPGDTTLATVGGESVVQTAKTQAEKTANTIKDFLGDIFGMSDIKSGTPEATQIYDRFENQLRNQLGLDPIESLEPSSKKSDAPVSYITNDNSVTVAGGGSSSPSTSTNIISQFGNYSQHTRFNSLAGGNPLA